ncbi:MAG TPA: PD-(D/E)XK nuclease family protein [Candidatus Paceibacterota bacterium]
MPYQPSTLKLSRSALKLFQECPRCFWLDLHHKIKRPPGYPYTLSAAVDYLVKQEFDGYRIKDILPPVFDGIDAKLYKGPELPDWRNNFRGVSYFDEALNAILYGAVDDILEFPDGSLAVVDYKSSGSREITIYDDYRKQMEIYSYLMAQNGFKVQPHAYFVFYLVQKDGGGFKNFLPFKEELRRIDVQPEWVDATFEQAVKVARQNHAPEGHPECKHCSFVLRAGEFNPLTVKSSKKNISDLEQLPLHEF